MRFNRIGRLPAVVTVFGLLLTGAAAAFAAVDWIGAELIDAGAQEASSQKIAVDDSGKAVAVWRQHDGTAWRIYANGWDGSTWSGAAVIDAGATDGAEPQVAEAGAGKAFALWRQRSGTNYRVYVNRWNGSAWSGAAIINAETSYDAFEPKIAANGSGQAIAVWRQHDGAAFRIYANRWDGGTWSGPEAIDAGATGAAAPQIALDGAGNAVAVWEQVEVGGTHHRIHANRWNGSAWSGAAVIDAAATDATNPHVALDGAGNAVAVWEQLGADGVWHIQANRWTASAWGTAARIDSETGDKSSFPQIAVDSAGRAVAVWTQNDGARDRIYANRWDGNAWTGAAIIDPGTIAAADPQVAVDSSGNAIAVWRQFDESFSLRIYANRWSGGAWAGAASIDAGATGADAAQIAMNGAGEAVAVWAQWDGTFWRVYANRFVLAVTPGGKGGGGGGGGGGGAFGMALLAMLGLFTLARRRSWR